MDDIRLFETDGDFLVLEAQDGQKFRLLVDETVRSSIKREKIQQLDSITITPREIQEEIRNGATIEQLIKDSGASFEFIEKFAAPVIAELEHIVSSALSVRLTIAGDRYNDTSQIEFGEIISGRLITSGASGIHWKAKKIEPNSWHIIANYTLNGANGSATWAFDPRRLTLSPDSETAVTLSSQETISNSVIPKLRTVQEPPASASAIQQPNAQETMLMDDVIPIGRSTDFETPIAQDANFDRPVPSTPAAFLKPVHDSTSVQEPDSSAQEPESLSATADLLEALRRKRNEREENTSVEGLEHQPETSSLRVIDIEPVVTAQPENDSVEPVPQAVSDEKPASAKKGRAAMPSWDEIVFGTKADD
jgi:hypothetical protein